MKKKIAIDLPTETEITSRLDLHSCHPRLTRAEEALTIAEAELEDARGRLEELTAAAEAMPAKIKRGEATPADLEAAIREQRSCALSVPANEIAVEEARTELSGALRRALGAVASEASRRGALLQREADKLTPALDALRELESRLADAARSVDERGVPVSPNLEPVVWPKCNADRRRQLATAQARDHAAAGNLTPGEYARKYGRSRWG